MEEQETQEMNKKLRIGVHHPRDLPGGYRLSPPQGYRTIGSSPLKG
jgi:hypothetical protein